MNDETKKELLEELKKEIVKNINLYAGDMVVSVLEQNYEIDDDNWEEYGDITYDMLINLKDKIEEFINQIC